MPTSTAIQAAMQAGAPTTPAAGSDAQNAHILASIAAAQPATPQQSVAASQAVASRVAPTDQPAPAALTQKLNASAQAPYDLAASIAGSEKGAAGAYNSAIASGTGNYMHQIAAAMPLVNALASAQIAKANNDYALSQQQNGYQQGELAYQNRNLDYQNRQLDLSQSNPALYGNAAQKQAAQNVIVQQANSDPGLDADEKKSINQVLGQAADYPSALAGIAGGTYDTGPNKGKPFAHAQQIQKYLAAYYGAGATPQVGVAAPAAVAGPASASHNPLAGVNNAVGSALATGFNPQNIAGGANVLGGALLNANHAVAGAARKLLGF